MTTKEKFLKLAILAGNMKPGRTAKLNSAGKSFHNLFCNNKLEISLKDLNENNVVVTKENLILANEVWMNIRNHFTNDSLATIYHKNEIPKIKDLIQLLMFQLILEDTE